MAGGNKAGVHGLSGRGKDPRMTWPDIITGMMAHGLSPRESWERIAHTLIPHLCRQLPGLGVQTLEGLVHMTYEVPGSPMWTLGPTPQRATRQSLEEAAKWGVAPLPTTLPGLVEHLLASLNPRSRAITEARYREGQLLQVVADRFRTAPSHLDQVAHGWRARFPQLIRRITEPLVTGLNEHILLGPPDIRALGLADAGLAMMLLRTAGRGEAQRVWFMGERGTHHRGWRRGWSTDGSFATRIHEESRAAWQTDPLVPGWVTELGTAELDERTSAFCDAMKTITRPHLSRDDLTHIWDEHTGLPLTDASLFPLLAELLGRPVGPDGMHDAHDLPDLCRLRRPLREKAPARD